MIVERMVFHAKYGMGDALLALAKEYATGIGRQVMPAGSTPRILTDFTGTMFQVIVEVEYPSLEAFAEMEARSQAQYAAPEFGAWFSRMQPLVERGERQLLNLVQL